MDYLTLSLLLRMPMILYVDAQPKCMEVTYLEVGKEGIISCSLEPFYAVSWYTKEDYDEEKSPLLYFNGNKHGRVNEYDVHPNGSFIFRNVSLNHAGSYTVTMLEDVTSDLFVREVQLGVYVTPDPTYPVVEGRIMQQHVYMDANRNGQLSCSMRRVYPNISLVWTVVDPTQSKKILFQEDVVGRKQNEDNTFDITLTSLYEVTDQSVPRITIQCGVANEIGEVLSSRTKVDLLFSSVYPVVNGHVNRRHVYLDVDREGHLTCIKENVDAGTTLVWKIVDPSMQEQITFQSREIVSNNNDGTVTINQTFDYEINDHSVDRITIECAVVTPDSDDILLATKVDLLFQNDGNTNNSTRGAVFAEILTVFLVIALGLLVLILWYKNRKMQKKLAVKFLKAILDMHTHNEYTSPEEGTNGTALYCTPNGGPVVCSDDVCDASRQEVQDINESLESPDSGNSGSNSRESSGSEASEKSGLMDDIEMSCNNSKQDPLHVNKEGFEDTPMV